jgi:L-alanine-DL-glutamate epimerase-like enolase superfamily enzyme
MSEPSTITKLDIRAYRAEIANPVVASFGSIPSRATVLLRIEDSDGAHGWGEIWGNFPTITTEYRAKLAAWTLPSRLIGATIDEPGAFTDALAATLRVLKVQAAETGPVEGVLAATNQALWDLRARKRGVPLRHLLNPDAPNAVPAYASGLNPTDCVDVTERSRAEGHRAFKLKIGFGAETDRRNLEALRAGMKSGERLFVDANQCWNLAEARAQIPVLLDNGVDWFEEPMIAIEAPGHWRALAAECPIPLAGGENILERTGLESCTGWFGYIQPDIGKWGGVDGCFDIAQKAVAAGKVYCPHWLSGGVGLMHSAQVLAAAGGAGLLEVDTNENPLRTVLIETLPGVRDGKFQIGDGPGIGIEPPVAEMDTWLQSHETFS